MTDISIDLSSETWEAEFYSSPLFQLVFTEYYPQSELLTVTHPELGEFRYPLISNQKYRTDKLTYHETSLVESEIDEELLELYKNRVHGDKEIELWDKETYILNDIHSDAGKVQLSISDFYTSLSYSTKLLVEVFDAVEDYADTHDITELTPNIVQEMASSPEFFLSQRNANFADFATVLDNAFEWHRPIGGTYLTALRDATGKISVLVGKRETDLTSWPELHTIFPAGYMQPETLQPFTGGISFQHMTDEFSREVFNVSEEAPPSGVHARGIKQLLKSGDAVFSNTGFGFSAEVLNAECTGLLFIDDPTYTEYVLTNIEQNYEHMGVTAVPLEMFTNPSVFEDILHPNNVTPTSAFAFYNGIRKLDEIVDEKQTNDVLSVINHE